MNCGLCGASMCEQRRNGVTVDICGGCGGVWLDAGEVRGVGIAPEAEEGLRSVMSKGALDLEHVCPRDGAPLHVAGLDGVTLRGCSTCFGLLLDVAALEQVRVRNTGSAQRVGPADVVAEGAFTVVEHGSMAAVHGARKGASGVARAGSDDMSNVAVLGLVGADLSDGVVGDLPGDVMGGGLDGLGEAAGGAAEVAGEALGGAGDALGGVAELAGDLIGGVFSALGEALGALA